jgi:hypothetical protein
MLILRGPAAANQIANPAIRSLVEQRFVQVCAGEPYDYDLHGYMVVVEPGDSVEHVEAETGCSILFDPFEDVSYGHPDFSTSFDILEAHHDEQGNVFYELVYILSDSGFAVTALIPKVEGIPAGLLAMCAEYATPATEHADP